MPEPLNAPYGAGFAGAYDRHWGAFALMAAEAIVSYVRRRRPGVALHVLDLGCGTGLAAEVFCRHGFRVTGIDRSEAMLDRARARCRAATFVRGDITESGHVAQGSIDVVACLYDTLNHLDDLAAISAALVAAAIAARPEALLIADLNTRFALSGWDEPMSFDDSGATIDIRGVADGGGDAATLTITRTRNGQVEFVETQSERAYPLAAVSEVAGQAGWRDLRWSTYADLAAACDDPEARRRVVLVGRRD